MVGIFDSEIGEGASIQESIGTPGITPQQRAADVNVDPNDTYNLRASRRVEELKAISAAKRAQREQRKLAEQQAQQQVDKENRLQGIVQGVKSKFDEIEAKVTNPVEANRLKREVEFSAMAAAGKANASYIKSLTDVLSTKRTFREDGLVEITDSRGNVVGLSGGDVEVIKQARKNKQIESIDSVLPGTLDTVDTILQKDALEGNFFDEKAINSMLRNFKNESGRLKRVAEDYHLTAANLPSSEIPKLTEQAQRDYMKAASGLFKSFTSAEMLKAVRSGKGIDRSDVEISMQQVKQDLLDEVRDNKVPVNINDIDSFMNKQIENIIDTYDNIQKNDGIAVEQKRKYLENTNAIASAIFADKYNMAQIENQGKVLNYLGKYATIIQNLSQAAAEARLTDPNGDSAKQLLGVSRQFSSALEGTMPIVNKMNDDMFKLNFDLQDIDKNLARADTKEDMIDTLNKLGRAASIENFHAAGQVNARLNILVPKIMESPEFSQEEKNGILSQVQAYNQSIQSVYRQDPTLKEESEGFLEQWFELALRANPGMNIIRWVSGEDFKDLPIVKTISGD